MKVLFLIKDYVVEPLGIAYLSSSLKAHGHTTDIIKTKNRNAEEIAREIYRDIPDIIAYSITTGSQDYYLELNNDLKELFDNSFISVFGGPHVTYFENIKDELGVDYAIRGESENTFIRLVDALSEGHEPTKEEYLKMDALIQDLDSIPFPDRELLYKYDSNKNNPIKNIITSRGCPYFCNYCYNSLYKKLYSGQRFVRYRSAQNVIDECLELEKYPLEVIFFEDDEFIANKKRFQELMLLYAKKVKTPFHCQVRVEHLDETAVAILKHSGCISVTFAMESGSDRVRTKLLNRKMSREQILKGAKLLRDAGIPFRLQGMVGLPSESWEEMLETLDLMIECKPTLGWVSIFQPYPSLPLGDISQKLGLWDGEIDQFSKSFFEETVLDLPSKLKRRVNNLQKVFALIVRFPFLRMFTTIITSLPENRLYALLYQRFKVYIYDQYLYNPKRRIYGFQE